MLSLKAEGLAGPQPGQHRQALVQLLGADLAVGVFAEVAEAGVDGAEAHGEDDAPAGKPVEGGCFAGQLPRAQDGQWGQHGAQADALGQHGSGGEGDPGIRPPDGLPDEEAVPTGLFGLAGELRRGMGVSGW